MAELAPSSTVTFTIKALPRTERQRKTLQRLMRLQPKVQRTLSRLAHVRRRETPWTQRGGRLFARRKTPTKVVVPTVGASFTLRITPQIVADVRSVERYLATK
ncbi:MAG: hypothetical protein KF724_03965 [Phycisphaeraceae bacterium]|nr:hypothetical protein [Phycisphaeraceae bacterium]